MNSNGAYVAHFVYNYYGYSGASKQAIKLANHLSNRAIFFDHSRVGTSEEKVNANGSVFRVPLGKVRKFFYILLILIRHRCDVLHLHGYFRHGVILGVLLRKKVLLKTTLFGKDDFSSILENSKFPTLDKYLLSKVTVNVALTQQLYKVNKENNIAPVLIIPNGVDVGYVENNKELCNFCYVGIICERKRTLESIKYFHRNYSHIPSAMLYIVGPDSSSNYLPEFDEQYFERCRLYVKRSGLSNSVVFTGQLSRAEVEILLSKSKALLFFSEFEGMPNVMLEAMANNCVPITYELGGVAEEIWGCKKEFILEDAHKEISLELIDLEVSSGSMIERIDQSFSYDVVAKKYSELYEKICNE